VDAALVALAAVAAAALLLSAYARLEKGYTGAYDCYRTVSGEASRAATYVNSPNSYTSTRFRATFYYSNGTVVVRGSAPRAQCYAYFLTGDSRGELVLVRVEG
jgi:hypothetical protein